MPVCAEKVLSIQRVSLLHIKKSNMGRRVVARVSAQTASGESLLARITSPLIGRLTAGSREFTSREREIASLVRDGRTSKEIAERLCLTIKAVDFHRMNLRKKLGIGGSTQSLTARLLDLEQP